MNLRLVFVLPRKIFPDFDKDSVEFPYDFPADKHLNNTDSSNLFTWATFFIYISIITLDQHKRKDLCSVGLS